MRARSVPDVEVLLYQASDQSRLWTVRPAPEKVMEKAVGAHNKKTEAATRDARL